MKKNLFHCKFEYTIKHGSRVTAADRKHQHVSVQLREREKGTALTHH